MKKIGVIGCGQMGGGIAQLCAQSGFPTLVNEVSQEFLNKGLDRIKTTLSKSVEKGKLTKEAMEKTMANLKGTTRLEDFRDVDIAIEAVIENFDEKKRVFSTLDKVCPATAILATNTSSISIMDIASTTKRPDKVIGMHFFNPVPVMNLVEIVMGLQTSNETYTAIKELSASLGKAIVTTKDRPGFIVNYLLIPYLLDAIRTLESGAATKEDIDTAMKNGCNMPMGPLTLSDFIGNDTVLYIANVLYEGFKETKYVAPPLLRQMVTAGLLGKKTGKGFYSY